MYPWALFLHASDELFSETYSLYSMSWFPCMSFTSIWAFTLASKLNCFCPDQKHKKFTKWNTPYEKVGSSMLTLSEHAPFSKSGFLFLGNFTCVVILSQEIENVFNRTHPVSKALGWEVKYSPPSVTTIFLAVALYQCFFPVVNRKRYVHNMESLVVIQRVTVPTRFCASR